MRVSSELWVKAYLRTAAVHHCPGVVVKRGDAQSGAIFIKVVCRDRTAFLFGPAPTGFDESQERAWIPFLKGQATFEATVDAALDQETRFDRDIWIVEIESAEGLHFLESWLLATRP